MDTPAIDSGSEAPTSRLCDSKRLSVIAFLPDWRHRPAKQGNERAESPGQLPPHGDLYSDRARVGDAALPLGSIDPRVAPSG